MSCYGPLREQAEVDYVTGAGLPLHTLPTLYDTFAESPLFSSFNGPGSVSMAQGFVAALSEQSGAHRPLLCSTCGASDGCVVAALTPWNFQPSVAWEGVSMVAYCIPPAQQLTAHVHIATYPAAPVACPAYVCGDVGGQASLTFADFARQPPGSLYLLLGFSSIGTQVLSDGQQQALQTTSHMLYVVPASDPTPGQPFLHTLTLRSQVLTPSMVRYLFGVPTAPTGTTVTDCAINVLVEVRSSIPFAPLGVRRAVTPSTSRWRPT